MPHLQEKNREQPLCYPLPIKPRALIQARLSRLELNPNTLLKGISTGINLHVGSDNGMAKLNEIAVKEIRMLAADEDFKKEYKFNIFCCFYLYLSLMVLL